MFWSVRENPHNSWALWDILIKFCILIYFNIVQPLWYAKWWRGFAEHHFGRSSCFSENACNSETAWYVLIKFCILINLNIIEKQIILPGGYSDIFIHAYAQAIFLGSKFWISLFFLDYIFGYEDFVVIFWGSSRNWTIFMGSFLCILCFFS